MAVKILTLRKPLVSRKLLVEISRNDATGPFFSNQNFSYVLDNHTF